MLTVSQIKKASNLNLNFNKETDIQIHSFTEPEVFIFSREGIHSNIMNGRFVQGGSSFKKHFTEYFDQEARANGLSKHWGVDGDKIIRLWKAKGKSATTFGTAFHHILEKEHNSEEWDASEVIDSIKLTRRMYMANLEIGEKICNNSKSADENYAKPTHQDIRKLMKASDTEIEEHTKQVVNDFKSLYNNLGFNSYKSLAEVYVSCEEYNMGGEIDLLVILDEEKKICRVQDYKFKDKEMDKESSNNKLLNELKKNKASENDIIRIQLSFYAYCLERAGWIVKGGDVYSRNGEWKHYPIDLIPFQEMDILLNKYLK